MNYSRRSVYDDNSFRVDCRICEDLELKTEKRPDGSITSVVTFLAVTNSNQYSNRVNCHFYLRAHGKKAERIFATVAKGYGISVEAELKELLEKKVEKTLRKSTITRYNVFDINRFHIVSVPNNGTNEETTTDIFFDMKEEPTF